MPAVVLLSAGLDSAVNLKRAFDESGVALALTFDYGHRAARREAAAAAFMCQQLGISHDVIPLPWLAEIADTALVASHKPLPEVTPQLLGDPAVASGDTARAVWVPNRNGVFVSIAAAYAESLGAEAVVAGFNAEEAASFPDNSADFIAAANQLLHHSTRRRPRLISYTIDLRKADIVRLGRSIDAPIPSLWSCYRGEAEHCWRCESCARLERALREAEAWQWFHTHRLLP
jgi:7-cyano-7-deazaguanine synthase